MASSIRPSEETDSRFEGDDARNALIEKWEKADAEGSTEADDASEDEDTAGSDADGEDDEHTDSDTSDEDRDGDAADSEDDSADDDDDEHPDDSDSDDDDDLDDDTADDEEDEDGDDDEEAETGAETRSALGRHGADLNLTDVPKEYRGLIEKKIRSIDAAYTRANQEATAFRSERAKFQAEQRFIAENPELDIVERLLKDPTLIEKVEARLNKLDGDEDNTAAFQIIVKDKRRDALDQAQKAAEQHEQLNSRADAVENYARDRAAAVGLPWRFAERAVETALLRKPEDKRDLTNAEIDAAIRAEAKELQQETRATRRDESRKGVKRHTEARKGSRPVAKKPGGSATVRPAPAKMPKVDHNSEESRQAAMDRSAKRILNMK